MRQPTQFQLSPRQYRNWVLADRPVSAPIWPTANGGKWWKADIRAVTATAAALSVEGMREAGRVAPVRPNATSVRCRQPASETCPFATGQLDPLAIARASSVGQSTFATTASARMWPCAAFSYDSAGLVEEDLRRWPPVTLVWRATAGRGTAISNGGRVGFTSSNLRLVVRCVAGLFVDLLEFRPRVAARIC